MARMKELEDENRRLKKMYIEEKIKVQRNICGGSGSQGRLCCVSSSTNELGQAGDSGNVQTCKVTVGGHVDGFNVLDGRATESECCCSLAVCNVQCVGACAAVDHIQTTQNAATGRCFSGVNCVVARCTGDVVHTCSERTCEGCLKTQSFQRVTAIFGLPFSVTHRLPSAENDASGRFSKRGYLHPMEGSDAPHQPPNPTDACHFSGGPVGWWSRVFHQGVGPMRVSVCADSKFQPRGLENRTQRSDRWVAPC
jgi:hypothetical protein